MRSVTSPKPQLWKANTIIKMQRRLMRRFNRSVSTRKPLARLSSHSPDWPTVWKRSAIFWIAGGVAKEGGIETLAELFPHITKAYLIGEAAPSFHKTLKKKKVDTKVCGDLEKAVLCATRDAMQSGKAAPIVLLSPACASFDQFKNFETRGEAFREQASRIIDLFEQEKNRMTAA